MNTSVFSRARRTFRAASRRGRRRPSAPRTIQGRPRSDRLGDDRSAGHRLPGRAGGPRVQRRTAGDADGNDRAGRHRGHGRAEPVGHPPPTPARSPGHRSQPGGASRRSPPARRRLRYLGGQRRCDAGRHPVRGEAFRREAQLALAGSGSRGQLNLDSPGNGSARPCASAATATSSTRCSTTWTVDTRRAVQLLTTAAVERGEPARSRSPSSSRLGPAAILTDLVGPLFGRHQRPCRRVAGCCSTGSTSGPSSVYSRGEMSPSCAGTWSTSWVPEPTATAAATATGTASRHGGSKPESRHRPPAAPNVYLNRSQRRSTKKRVRGTPPEANREFTVSARRRLDRQRTTTECMESIKKTLEKASSTDHVPRTIGRPGVLTPGAPSALPVRVRLTSREAETTWLNCPRPNATQPDSRRQQDEQQRQEPRSA